MRSGACVATGCSRQDSRPPEQITNPFLVTSAAKSLVDDTWYTYDLRLQVASPGSARLLENHRSQRANGARCKRQEDLTES